MTVLALSTRQRISARFDGYLQHTPAPVVIADVLGIALGIAALLSGPLVLEYLADMPLRLHLHGRLLSDPTLESAGAVYRAVLSMTLFFNVAWLTRAIRNLILISILRVSGRPKSTEQEAHDLPPWPYTRESFTLILGEIQDRDGTPVPNPRSPKLRPRWLTLPELALYTGVFVTGGTGTGKTVGVAYPALHQLLGFTRPIRIKRADGTLVVEGWKFSGLVLDEKGDFTRKTAEICEAWGRSGDLIRLTPGGRWIWNIIYNPNIPAWAVGYQLAAILRNLNKDKTGPDPFWEQKPKALLTEYLGLLDDADGYYTIYDYLAVLKSEPKQDRLQEQAISRFQDDPDRLTEIRRRWASITSRRKEMGAGLRGSLMACAEAGLELFQSSETLRRTFCPSRDEYFEEGPDGLMRPGPHVFTGFDQVLDYGKIVGLEMSKQVWFDAATFVQVALKSQWMDAVQRRDTYGRDGKLLFPPRFGQRIGYCPTFLMADEAQQSATPRDAEFKGVARSKRASTWELTQSHTSIKAQFGHTKHADTAAYFQNSMTHIYLRQSDAESIEIIQKECDKRPVPKVQLSVTENGSGSSQISYVEGAIVHDAVGFSSQKTVSVEEKPFIEADELKQLPNNVAIVLPSNGERTLPATVTFLRPLWLFGGNPPELRPEIPWHRWPAKYRPRYNLDNIPQDLSWSPSGQWSEPLPEEVVIPASASLSGFVHDPAAFPKVPDPEPESDADGDDQGDTEHEDEDPGDSQAGARAASLPFEKPLDRDLR
jgi:hypothetical protein